MTRSMLRSLPLLSLDASATVLSDLGLYLSSQSPTGKVQHAIRAQLGWPWPTARPTEGVIKSLASILHPPDFAKLRVWIEEVFPHDENPWPGLQAVFGTAAQDFRTKHTDVIGLGSEGKTVYELYREIVYGYNYPALEARYHPSKLSAWDEAMLIAEVEDIAGLDWNPFADQAYRSASTYRFRQFWGQIRGLLKPYHYDRLTELALLEPAADWPAGCHAGDLALRSTS